MVEVSLPPDILFHTQADLIDDLIAQRDRARALAARMVVLAMVLTVALAAAMAALVARGVGGV